MHLPDLQQFDTFQNIPQTCTSKTVKLSSKLLRSFKEPREQECISFSEFQERMEIENDPTPKIGPDDHHFFPPGFHHIPAEKCQSRPMEHDSPWNENFGKTEKTTAEKQAESGKSEKRREMKTAKRKRFTPFRTSQDFSRVGTRGITGLLTLKPSSLRCKTTPVKKTR